MAAQNQGLFQQLFKEGKLPEVKMSFSLSRHSIVDLMVAAVIAALVIVLVTRALRKL